MHLFLVFGTNDKGLVGVIDLEIVAGLVILDESDLLIISLEFRLGCGVNIEGIELVDEVIVPKKIGLIKDE